MMTKVASPAGVYTNSNMGVQVSKYDVGDTVLLIDKGPLGAWHRGRSQRNIYLVGVLLLSRASFAAM